MIDKNKKILIVGLGLLGGSYAQGLTDSGYSVGAIDKKKSTIKFALEKGIIKYGTTNISEEFIKMFDIIIFGLYPKTLVKWLKQYQMLLKTNAIITDVTGIKEWLVNEIMNFIRKDISFVGAHPMAGKEVNGIEYSDKNIFKDANYIITPTKMSTNESIEVARDIAMILKFKNIAILTPKEHDEMIGFLSQLTHCIAISLMTCKESAHLVEYTGDSFRDLTRIAKINEEMWSELFILNKEELLKQMNLFLQQFTRLKTTIENSDVNAMKEIMKLSTFRRKYFDK